MSEPNIEETENENTSSQDDSKKEDPQFEGFPDATEINSLIGDDFEMPSITTTNEESAPTAEPEPLEDPETGESYFDEESQSFERPQNPSPTATGETDKKGRIFDPQLHAVDENGNPRYSKKGLFIFLRKNKRGNVDTASIKKGEYFETGLLYFDGASDTLAALLGDHWKPENEDQRKSMGRSVARYLESQDAPQLTPAQELLLKSATYSAPRIAHTDTIDNAKLLLGKTIMGVKNFWATITGKKKPKKETPEKVPEAEEVKPDADSSNN